jgi:hypothetical protein
MLDNGDGDTEVWATEFGWTILPGQAALSQPAVSEERQAAYLLEALSLASSNYPWMGRMAVWNLCASPESCGDFAGFNILREDGAPRTAYHVLQKALEPSRPTSRPTPEVPCSILARDVVVRLGDSAVAHPHWVNLYGGHCPSLAWQGDFYLKEPLEKEPWILSLEVMQVDEQANKVAINSIPLDPPAIPPDPCGDPSSTWRQVRFQVPPGALRHGLNLLEVRASRRLSPYQAGPEWESFQFRNAFLYPEGEGLL